MLMSAVDISKFCLADWGCYVTNTVNFETADRFWATGSGLVNVGFLLLYSIPQFVAFGSG